MKKTIALVLALALLFCLTGCAGEEKTGSSLQEKLNGVQTPGTTDTDTDAQDKTETPLSDKKPASDKTPSSDKAPAKGNTDKQTDKQDTDAPEKTASEGGYDNFAGIYVSDQQMDEVTTVLQIYPFADMLLLEYSSWMDGYLYDTWCEEFWPDPDIEEDGQYESVTGMSQCFSAMNGTGNYWKTAEPRTIVILEDGVEVQGPWNENTFYERDDDRKGVHESIDYQFPEPAANGENDAGAPIGKWESDVGILSIYLEIREDNTMCCIYKPRHKAVFVFDGEWVMDSSTGNLECCLERIGGGPTPYFPSFWFDEDGEGLLLMDTACDMAGLFDEGLYLWPAEEDEEWTFDYPMSWMMGTYAECMSEAGAFCDENGEWMYYSYYVPQLLLDSYENPGTAGEINEEIYTRFAAVAEDGLTQAWQEKAPVYHTVNYGASNYTGVEMLVVFALSDTEEDTCCAYYYDRERDVRLSTSEMLEYLGISTQNFLDTVRTAAGTYFDSEYSYMSHSERQESGFDEGRAWTISDEQINLDMPLFVNEAGNMMAIARISSLENGGWYYAALNLNFDSVG